MSVEAYLVNQDIKIIDGKEYVHEDLEYLWNNWHDDDIWSVLWPYMNDMTNDDCIGTIEIIDEEFERFKENYTKNEEIKKVVDNHKDVFIRLDSEFKKGKDFVKIYLY